MSWIFLGFVGAGFELGSEVVVGRRGLDCVGWEKGKARVGSAFGSFSSFVSDQAFASSSSSLPSGTNQNPHRSPSLEHRLPRLATQTLIVRPSSKPTRNECRLTHIHNPPSPNPPFLIPTNHAPLPVRKARFRPVLRVDMPCERSEDFAVGSIEQAEVGVEGGDEEGCWAGGRGG